MHNAQRSQRTHWHKRSDRRLGESNACPPPRSFCRPNQGEGYLNSLGSQPPVRQPPPLQRRPVHHLKAAQSRRFALLKD